MRMAHLKNCNLEIVNHMGLYMAIDTAIKAMAIQGQKSLFAFSGYLLTTIGVAAVSTIHIEIFTVIQVG